MQKILCYLLILLISPLPGLAAVIRDDEIESTIKRIAIPIFKAAKLNPDDIDIHIISDPNINAFVYGGQKIFIHTGLLTQFETADVLSGVIAHETGHIANGHLIQKEEKHRSVSKGVMVGLALGLAGALAGGGAGDVGLFSALGSMQVAKRDFLSHSRVYEKEADSFALNILKKLSWSPVGLVKLFKLLNIRQKSQIIDPYTITHPLDKERIKHVKEFIEKNKSDYKSPANLPREFKRSIVKLKAFLYPLNNLKDKYQDSSIDSKYAQAVITYRQGKITTAINHISELIKLEPRNPYFHELKGQIYSESGQFKKAEKCYEDAVILLPNSALIKLGLAIVQINLFKKGQNNQYLTHAVNNLNDVLRIEPKNIDAFYYLSTAHGLNKKIGLANLALADREYYLQNKKESIKFAKKALKHLKKKTPDYFRAQDILFALEGFKN
jgi:predicted Zn-dependent protease